MTKQQKSEAIALLLADCQTRYFYMRLDKEANTSETCALGCLAKAAGIPDETLLAACSSYITCQPIDTSAPVEYQACFDIAKAIWQRFGLTVTEQRTIQIINDEKKDRDKRVNAVCGYVADLETTED